MVQDWYINSDKVRNLFLRGIKVLIEGLVLGEVDEIWDQINGKKNGKGKKKGRRKV